MVLQNFNLVYNTNIAPELEHILCAYRNKIKSLQVIKIENITSMYWGKVVFPGETILFKAFKQARLKIFSNDNSIALLTDTIPCHKLQVSDDKNLFLSS